MATFARGYWTRKAHTTNEPLRKSLRGSDSDTPSAVARVTWITDAADSRTLRGIPAIGRNCPGRIAGTDPQQAVS